MCSALHHRCCHPDVSCLWLVYRRWVLRDRQMLSTQYDDIANCTWRQQTNIGTRVAGHLYVFVTRHQSVFGCFVRPSVSQFVFISQCQQTVLELYCWLNDVAWPTRSPAATVSPPSGARHEWNKLANEWTLSRVSAGLPGLVHACNPINREGSDRAFEFATFVVYKRTDQKHLLADVWKEIRRFCQTAKYVWSRYRRVGKI